MNSLLLDRTVWDLCLDSSGSIAMASNPYSLAQNAACAIKLFRSELWYDTSQGVPYFGQVLGQFPSLAFLKAQLVAAALTVPEVVSAVCIISAIEGRRVTGQVQVTDTAGVTTVAAF